MTKIPQLLALLAATAATAAMAATPPTQVQPAPADAPERPAQAPTATDDTLYRALGGRETIQRFTDDFYDRMLRDPALARYFDGINAAYLKRVLADYFCVTAGGPCTYDGVGMKAAHAHLGIDRAAFNGLVEHLQKGMERAGVPFSAQNQLLARMAFFHRDIITH